MNTRLWVWVNLCLAACGVSDLSGTMAPSTTTVDMGSDADSATTGSGGSGAAGAGNEDAGVPSDPGPVPESFEGDPEQRGDFEVIHDEAGLTIPNPGSSNINAGLFLPSEDGKNPLSGPKVPLLIVHPGFGAQWGMYTELSSHLASWGYVVVTINHAGFGQDHMRNAEQTLATIAWAQSNESGLAELADTTRVATIGHSMGGKIALLSAYLDAGAHVKAIIGWDPVTAGGPMAQNDPTDVLPDKVKQLPQPYLMFGAAPGSCSPEGGNAQAIFEARDSSTAFLYFPDANHMDWVDLSQSDTVGGIGGAFCGGQSGVPMDVHRITMRTQVAFLKRHLEGLTVDEAYFDPQGPLLGPDIQSGLLTVSNK